VSFAEHNSNLIKSKFEDALRDKSRAHGDRASGVFRSFQSDS